MHVAAPPAVVERCLDEAGIAFLFAPAFHPSMRHAGADAPGARRAHRVQPARTADQSGRRDAQLVGVPRPELTELVARSLAQLGAERAWVVHGADGLDEISTTGYTKVSECRDGAVNTFYLHPADVGLPQGAAGALRGGDARRNAAIARAVLTGEPRRAARHRAAQRRRRAADCRRAATIRGRHRDGGARRSTAAAPRGRSRRWSPSRGEGDAAVPMTERARSARRRSWRRRGGSSRSRRSASSRARAGARAADARRRSARPVRGGAARRRRSPRVIAECKRRSPSRGILRAGLRSGRHRRAATRRPARRRFRC